MFENLNDKLESAFKKLRGHGKLNEANIEEGLKEVRMALLEADVHYRVVKGFIEDVRSRALGQEVLASLTPGQQVVKIVNEKLTELMGSRHEALNEERDQIVADAIATLSQREKEIIRQRYWEDASVAEIANFLEKSVSAATSLLNRIRYKLEIKLIAMGVSDTSSEVNRHVKGDTM